MPTIKGRTYRLTGEADELFRTIFPDLEEDAKFILISPEGMMTFSEEPPLFVDGKFRMPRFMMLSYYDIEFESE